MGLVTAAQIWYPNGANGPAYDLTKITWYAPDKDPAFVNVRFRGLDAATVRFPRASFEAAMAAVG
jgi:hypothetical protein